MSGFWWLIALSVSVTLLLMWVVLMLREDCESDRYEDQGEPPTLDLHWVAVESLANLGTSRGDALAMEIVKGYQRKQVDR